MDKAYQEIVAILKGRYTASKINQNEGFIADIIALATDNEHYKAVAEYMSAINAKANAEDRRICKRSSELWERERACKEIEKKAEYLNQLKAELMCCESAEARDRLRLAEYFKNNVKNKTVYDNTAYIKALGSILGYSEKDTEGEEE